ncbi:histidine kinase dimerization/phosphoacceptor domain -containing protein [Paraflavitalea pollutisoli]|uniref:tetratricopeptide repeat-containing sensor histidine kinase n=1 Tax=Paraflavitalea pollutisoli TaxID=3034143 RepID=UPI0023ED7709|nr:histidine kinase dimerization/phosphoacceptor domain -containing protein [Paraflavitalea sp. H1-2-19X]
MRNALFLRRKGSGETIGVTLPASAMLKHFSVTLLLFCILSNGIAQDKATATIPELLQQLRAASGQQARASLLLTIADAYILKPGEEKKDLDSAGRLISQAIELNKSIGSNELTGISLIVQSKLYREQGAREKGRASAQQAIVWADQYHLMVQMAYAHAEMATYYTWEKVEELDPKIKHLQVAADYFGKSDRVEMKARTLEHLGDCLLVKGDDESALTVLHQSVDLYKLAGVAEMHGVYDLLGGLYASLGEYKEGLRYGLLAVKTMEQVTDTSTHWLAIYNSVGLIYNRLNDFSEAVAYFKKSARIAEKFKDSAALRLVWGNMAVGYQSLHQLPQALQMIQQVKRSFHPQDGDPISVGFFHAAFGIYLDLKQMDSARAYLRRIEHIHQLLPADHPRNSFYYYVAIRYNLAIKDFTKAGSLADSLRNFAERVHLKRELERSHFYKFQADSALGNLSSAIRHYQQYITVKEATLGEATQRQINRLKVEFQTEKKDSDIQVLQHEKQEKEVQLQQAGLRFKLIVAGIVVLLLLLVLLYSRYSIKKKSNRLLLEQKQTIDSKNESLELMNAAQQKLLEEKEWLIKEIHHRVKNNLQIVMSLLNTQSSFLESAKAKDAILQSQHRMYALSLIHQRLYQTDNLAVIAMRSYIGELVGYLREGLQKPGKIHFVLEVDDMTLDTAQAVPIGLILNETITNALKYAFPGTRAGLITVRLNKAGEDLLRLEVTDNGVGLATGIDLLDSNSMGMNLIQILTRQLEGELRFSRHGGLSVEVVFPLTVPPEGPSAQPASEQPTAVH